MRRLYQNPTSGVIPVYADTAQSQEIGKLYPGKSCICIGEKNGMAIVVYKASASVPVISKVGFASALGIVGYAQ